MARAETSLWALCGRRNIPHRCPDRVPLQNTHPEAGPELSCARRRLNVSIHPASLGKVSFLLAKQLVLTVTGALKQGSLGAVDQWNKTELRDRLICITLYMAKMSLQISGYNIYKICME